MEILVDSRERRPLKFNKDIVSKVEKLDVGDYSAIYENGSRCPIVFERKSLSDLFSTLTQGHKRFRAEILRAMSSHTKIIIAIEGTVGEVLEGIEHSRYPGLSALRQLQTLWMRYDVPHLFFESRSVMGKYIVEFFKSFGRNYVGTADKRKGKGSGEGFRETTCGSVEPCDGI